MFLEEKYLQLAEEDYDRIFVIGDIHGCIRELTLLVNFLEKKNLNADDQVVFVGDYIDRGEESRAVIDFLIEFGKKYHNTIFLQGNHEDMFLDFLGFEGRRGEAYLPNGGIQTLRSYGLKEMDSIEKILDTIPNTHLAFFHGLIRYVITEQFVFVHGGLNPIRDLKAQLDDDLFWIRDEFIKNIHYFQKVVVYGHTPYDEVMFHLPYKIGIDTGLVYGNRLTCIDVRNDQYHQIRRGKKRVSTTKYPKK